jgi:hypothetical protein
MATTDGGRAFPGSGDEFAADGMSLRDYFAGQALAGFCAADTEDFPEGGFTPTKIAALAYQYADAMLEARKEK